jgi:uncharacterized membrane protein YedE/YeeE
MAGLVFGFWTGLGGLYIGAFSLFLSSLIKTENGKI